MPRALGNGEVIAESEDTVVVEGNHYFPRATLREDVLHDSSTTTFCPWKGTGHYYSLELDGQRSQDAVWYAAWLSRVRYRGNYLRPDGRRCRDLAWWGALWTATRIRDAIRARFGHGTGRA